jgi:hypothetical protein
VGDERRGVRAYYLTGEQKFAREEDPAQPGVPVNDEEF